MVAHWFKNRQGWWFPSMMMNSVGAVATTLVLIDISYAKFLHGAWMVMAALPAIIFVMFKIHTHYKSINEQLMPKEMKAATVSPPVYGCLLPLPPVTSL
jgi:K+ transporter